MDFPTKYGFLPVKIFPNKPIHCFLQLFFQKRGFLFVSAGESEWESSMGIWCCRQVPITEDQIGCREGAAKRPVPCSRDDPVTIRFGFVFFGFGMTWHDLFPSQLRKKTTPKRDHETMKPVGNFQRKKWGPCNFWVFDIRVMGWYLWQSNIVSTGQRHQSGISYGHVWFVMW